MLRIFFNSPQKVSILNFSAELVLIEFKYNTRVLIGMVLFIHEKKF